MMNKFYKSVIIFPCQLVHNIHVLVASLDAKDNALGPLYKQGLTLIQTWISNHMSSKMWDEINFPFPNFNGSK